MDVEQGLMSLKKRAAEMQAQQQALGIEAYVNKASCDAGAAAARESIQTIVKARMKSSLSEAGLWSWLHYALLKDPPSIETEELLYRIVVNSLPRY